MSCYQVILMINRHIIRHALCDCFLEHLEVFSDQIRQPDVPYVVKIGNGMFLFRAVSSPFQS